MTSLTILVTTCHTSIVTMPRKRAVMTDNERAELPSSLFILSGTNCFRRAAVWLVRWIVFEWIIILTIIGKQKGRRDFAAGTTRFLSWERKNKQTIFLKRIWHIFFGQNKNNTFGAFYISYNRFFLQDCFGHNWEIFYGIPLVLIQSLIYGILLVIIGILLVIMTEFFWS